MMKKLKARKPKKPSAGERLTAVENSVITAMRAFQEFKQMLGTKAIEALVERTAQLEKLFKPELERLLGELRAVRNLLDEKGQYSYMDKPRPELTAPPGTGDVIGPSLAEGPK
jgi:hypothetical protein